MILHNEFVKLKFEHMEKTNHASKYQNDKTTCSHRNNCTKGTIRQKKQRIMS